MPNLNHVALMGNVVRDIETKYTPSGSAIASFGLAINRKWKTDKGEQREETTFVDCEAFGKVAELIGQYCAKGSPLYVDGRLKLDQWDDKTTGAKRSKMKVIVENMQFLSSGDKSKQAPAKPAPKAAPKPAPDEDLDAEPDSIPF